MQRRAPSLAAAHLCLVRPHEAFTYRYVLSNLRHRIREAANKGDIVARSSGGGISVDDVDGQVQASTSGGSVNATLGKITGECRLETSGGGISVAVPASAALDVDAKTSAGSVHSDLPLVSAVASSKGTDERHHGSLKGKLNGGGTALVLRTSGGSINLKKL